MRSDLRVEPVRAVFPDRTPNERERPDRRQNEKDTFQKALQDAQEREHDGRQDGSRA
jgi:hypothetical protein